ncbi:MAG: hypothetical protein ACOYOS_12915 [Syntrophales bacterium]
MSNDLEKDSAMSVKNGADIDEQAKKTLEAIRDNLLRPMHDSLYEKIDQQEKSLKLFRWLLIAQICLQILTALLLIGR